MKLSSYSQGRENNFNLIRIVAALAVLVTHSFALAIGTGDAEPLRNSLGMTLGSMAVDVFFLTSGFLVTASLLNRQSTLEFIWARALRIFPALILMLILTTFAVGAFFSSLPLWDYLSSRETYIYFAKCSTLITGIELNLPGVFDGNPFKSQVNGSLWTMPYELRMYATLALIWFTLRIAQPVRSSTFKTIVVLLAITSGAYILINYFRISHTDSFSITNNISILFFMFFCGASFYVLKDSIVLSQRLFWFCLISLLLATVNKELFFVVYVITIAYILFYVAYVPNGFVRKYNRLGDYSYGIYIYAFPVQQSVAALIPGVSVLQMLLISVGTTIVLAMLSWHLIEKRALGLKPHAVVLTRRLMGGRLANATSNAP